MKNIIFSLLLVALIIEVDASTKKPIRILGILAELAPVEPHGRFGVGSVCGWNASKCFGGFPVVNSWLSKLRQQSRGVVSFTTPDTNSRLIRSHPVGQLLNTMAWDKMETDFFIIPEDYTLAKARSTSSTEELRSFLEKSTVKILLSNYPANDFFPFLIDKYVTSFTKTVGGFAIGFLCVWEPHASKVVPPLDAVKIVPYITSDLRDEGADIIICIVVSKSGETDTLISRFSSLDIDVVITSVMPGDAVMVNNTSFYFVSRTYSLVDLQLHPPDASNPSWAMELSSISLRSAPDSTSDVFLSSLDWVQDRMDEASRNNFIIGMSRSKMEYSQAQSINNFVDAPCRERECMMGVLGTESMRERMRTEIALCNGGSFRGDGWNAGIIRRDDIWTALPFGGHVCTLSVTGPALMRILDQGLSFLSTNGSLNQSISAGGYLQVSGITFTYNTKLPVGQRVVSISVLDPFLNQYLPISRRRIYTVAISDFLISGGDGFGEYFADHVPGSLVCSTYTTDEIVINYLRNSTGYTPHLKNSSVRVTEGTYLNLLNKTADDCDEYSKYIPEWSDCETCPEGTWQPLSNYDDCTHIAHEEGYNKLMIILLSIGSFCIVVIPILWKYTEANRRLRKLYNTNKIAEECSLAVVELRLSDLEYLKGLENPNNVQAAFIKIVQQMKYYMDFMPKTLLAVVHDDDEGELMRTVSEESMTSRSSTVNNHKQRNFSKTKRISIVAINSRDHLIRIKSETCHGKYLEMCNSIIEQNAGVIQSISGDRIIAGWNTASDRAFHAKLAASASYTLTESLSGINVDAHIGISTGNAQVGLYGGAGVRQFDNLSVVVPQAVALMLLNKHYDTRILIPSVFGNQLDMYHTQIIDHLNLKKLPVTFIMQLGPPVESDTEEWMYVFENAAVMNPFRDQNEAWILFIEKGIITLDQSKLSGRLLEISCSGSECVKGYVATPQYFDFL